MKKVLNILVVLSLVIALTACGSKEKDNDKNNDNSQNIQDKLLNNGYSEIVSNNFKKDFKNGDYILINTKDKNITYYNEESDYQIEYSTTDNTAWEYGCRYHYDDNTTTNDGEGIGDCNEETTNNLVEGKKKIDDELSSINISIDDLK